SDGNSLIFDGGRKTAKLDGLKSAAKLLDARMSDAYRTNGDESIKMLESLEQYQKNNTAYFKVGQPTLKYHTPFDADAYAKLKQYVDFVCDHITPDTNETRAFLKNLNEKQDERLRVSALIADMGGLLQEFALDLEGELNQNYIGKVDKLQKTLNDNSLILS
ncbi:MAG: hypothetical protein RR632_04135, partial [Christensenella sp.]